jgi:hypothetical protein
MALTYKGILPVTQEFYRRRRGGLKNDRASLGIGHKTRAGKTGADLV